MDELLDVTNSVTVKQIEKQIEILKNAKDKVKNAAQKEILQKKIEKYTFSRNKLIAIFKNDIINKKIDRAKINKNNTLRALYNDIINSQYKSLSLSAINALSKESRGWGELEKPKDTFQNFVDFIEGKNDWWSIATLGKATVVAAAVAGLGVLVSGALVPALIAAAAISPAVFKKEFKGLWKRMKDNHKAKNAIKDANLEEESKLDIEKDILDNDMSPKEQECEAEAIELSNKYFESDDALNTKLYEFKERYKGKVSSNRIDEILKNAGLSPTQESAAKAFEDLTNDKSDYKRIKEDKSKDETDKNYDDFKKAYDEVIKSFADATLSISDKRILLNSLMGKLQGSEPLFNPEDEKLKMKAQKYKTVCEGMVEICKKQLNQLQAHGNEVSKLNMKQAIKNAGMENVDLTKL